MCQRGARCGLRCCRGRTAAARRLPTATRIGSHGRLWSSSTVAGCGPVAARTWSTRPSSLPGLATSPSASTTALSMPPPGAIAGRPSSTMSSARCAGYVPTPRTMGSTRCASAPMAGQPVASWRPCWGRVTLATPLPLWRATPAAWPVSSISRETSTSQPIPNHPPCTRLSPCWAVRSRRYRNATATPPRYPGSTGGRLRFWWSTATRTTWCRSNSRGASWPPCARPESTCNTWSWPAPATRTWRGTRVGPADPRFP